MNALTLEIPVKLTQKKKYKLWDTNIKKFIASGGNPGLLKFHIPKSNVCRWKKQKNRRYIDLDCCGQKFKQVVRFIKNEAIRHYHNIACSVILIYQDMLFSINKGKELFEKSKKLILQKIDEMKNNIPLDKALELFSISHYTYSTWITGKMCLESLMGICVKRWANQLLSEEVKNIRKYLLKPEFKHWPWISVYYEGKRDGVFAFDDSTFYKYAHALGIERFQPKNRRKNHDTGIRAYYANEIWHADTTKFSTINHTKVWIYFITDNFSRFILGWTASLERSARIHCQLLKSVIEKYIKPGMYLPKIQYYVDDGSENKADIDDFILAKNEFIEKVLTLPLKLCTCYFSN